MHSYLTTRTKYPQMAELSIVHQGRTTDHDPLLTKHSMKVKNEMPQLHLNKRAASMN
jgi:hypothetical protein